MGTELIGKKIGMTQVFDDSGNFVGVTVVEVQPCTVLQKKTVETDGYAAYQLGAWDKKESRATKPMIGHCRKAGVGPVTKVREFRAGDGQELNVGDKITVAEFVPGQFVDVMGVGKGHGFQGVVKRYHFGGGDATHGAKGWHRRTGAVGQRMTPGHIYKGRKMPGHMGDRRVTTQNLRVIQVRETENLIFIEGALPGARGATVVIRHAKKKLKPSAKAA